MFGGKAARGLPTPPPTLSASHYRTFSTCWTASANCKSEIYSRESLAEGGGEDGVICETVPFVNRSLDRLQTPNQDSQYYFAPLLFRQNLSNSYWWLMASFSEFIYVVEGGYKRELEPVASPQLTILNSTGNTSLKKEVCHSNTRGTVRLCS